MGKRSAKAEAGERARRGGRGVPLTQTLDAIGLLLAKPSRPVDLVKALGCSRRTVERLLQKIEMAGLPPEVVHDGRNAYYSLQLETLHKRLRLK